MNVETKEWDKLFGYWQRDKSNKSLSLDILSRMSNAGDVDAASGFIELLSPPLKNDYQVSWLYAKAYIHAGRLSEAEVLFVALPQNSDLSREYGLSLCFYLQTKFDSAVQILRPLISQQQSAQQNDLTPEFYILLAKSEYHLGNIEDAYYHAMQLFNERNDTNSELLGLLAMLCFDLGKIDESAKHANTALKLEPSQHDALLAMASISIFYQDAKAAQNYCQQGLPKFSKSGRFWSVFAQAQMLDEMLMDAYYSISNATSLMSEHIGSWHIKAWIELSLQKMNDAKKSFEIALNLNRNFSESHGGLAVVAAYESNYEDAAKLAKVAMKLDPNCVSAQYALGLIAGHNGNQVLADDLIQDVLNRRSHVNDKSYLQLIQLLQKK